MMGLRIDDSGRARQQAVARALAEFAVTEVLQGEFGWSSPAGATNADNKDAKEAL